MWKWVYAAQMIMVQVQMVISYGDRFSLLWCCFEMLQNGIYCSSPALRVLLLLLSHFLRSRKLLACSALLSKKTMKSFGRFLEGSQEVLHQTHKRCLDLDSWIWNSWVYTHINALTHTNLNLYILERMCNKKNTKQSKLSFVQYFKSCNTCNVILLKVW